MLKTMNNPLGKWYFNEPSSFLSIILFVEEFLIIMLMFTSLSCELLKVDRNEINMIVNVSKSPVWSERCHLNISQCPTEGVVFTGMIS